MASLQELLGLAEDRGLDVSRIKSLLGVAEARKQTMRVSEMSNVVTPSIPDPEFEKMKEGTDVPLLQNTQSVLTPEQGKALIPTAAGLAGSAMFPPLAPHVARGAIARLAPTTIAEIADTATFVPGLTTALGFGARKTAEHALRFAPPVLGSAAGGAVGGATESAMQQGIVSPGDILQPFKALSTRDLPTAQQLDKVFSDAAASGKMQGGLEIAGSLIFAPFSRLLGPNADLIAEKGERVLKFAKEHNLPILPSSVTGSKAPILETLIDSVFPGGALTNKANLKEMARVLEAPLPDHTNFVTTLFSLERPKFLGKATGETGESVMAGAIDRAAQNNISTIKQLLQDSAQVVPGRGGIGNIKSQATSALLINGDKLALNIEKAREAGKLAGIPEKTLEALQNYALYAKAVGADVAENSPARKLLGPLTVTGAAAATAGLAYPLATGQEGIIGQATPGEIGEFVAASSFISWMAASMANPRGALNRYLTTGFLDSKMAQELLRMGINTAGRTAQMSFSDGIPALMGR